MTVVKTKSKKGRLLKRLCPLETKSKTVFWGRESKIGTVVKTTNLQRLSPNELLKVRGSGAFAECPGFVLDPLVLLP